MRWLCWNRGTGTATAPAGNLKNVYGYCNDDQAGPGDYLNKAVFQQPDNENENPE